MQYMITRQGDHYLLEATQLLPGTPEEIFPFFADANNLARIMPKSIGFTILTPQPIDMKPGTVIDYRISVRGLPMKWRTLITHWEPPHRFVDEQTRGPYRLWVHEHSFEQQGEQTLARDRIQFRARGPGWLAHPMHRLLVNRDVQKIFEHRTRVIGDALRQWQAQAE
jgi:ligand-binding SRPBCC domain-containing protein